jgi:hypothetical protein
VCGGILVDGVTKHHGKDDGCRRFWFISHNRYSKFKNSFMC